MPKALTSPLFSPGHIVFAGLVAALLLPSQIRAQIANNSVFGDFTLKCEVETITTMVCALAQGVVAAEDQRFLAEFALNLGSRTTGTDSPPRVDEMTFVLRTPTAMRLTTPPAFIVAEAEEQTTLNWLTCAQDACLAVAPVSEEGLRALSAAPSMTIGYLPLAAEAPISFQIGLAGLREGLATLGLTLTTP